MIIPFIRVGRCKIDSQQDYDIKLVPESPTQTEKLHSVRLTFHVCRFKTQAGVSCFNINEIKYPLANSVTIQESRELKS